MYKPSAAVIAATAGRWAVIETAPSGRVSCHIYSATGTNLRNATVKDEAAGRRLAADWRAEVKRVAR